MRLQVDATPEEQLRLADAAARIALPSSRITQRLVLIAGIVALLAYLLAPGAWLTVLSLALLTCAMTLGALLAEGRQRMRRAVNDDPHAREPYSVEVNEKELRTWCAHVDVRYTWSSITAVVETPEFYIFMRGPCAGPSVPKRLLDGAATAELRTTIETCASDRAHLLPS